MKTSKLNVLSILIAVILVSFNYNAVAQNKGKGQGQGWNQQNKQMHCNIPNLTEDQQKKMMEMRVSNMHDMLQFKNTMAEKKAHLNTLRTADKVDMNAINKLIDEMGALKTKMMKKKEAHRQEVRKMLTDDQRVFFDSRSGQSFKGGKCHGQGMGNGMHGQGRKGCKKF